MFDIILDDDFSFLEENIYVTNRPDIPVAQPSYKSIDVPGRDGTLTKFINYKDNEITINFVFVNKINASQKVRKVIPKILKAKKMIFSDDQEVFYKIKKSETANPQRSYRYKCDFSIKFTLEPFTYLSCEPIELLASNTIYNYGTYLSKPNIRIYATGNSQVTINGRTFLVNNVDGYVDINSELKRCFKGSTPKNNDMVGEFPYFDVGENNITLSSNVFKINITPNWRCL